MKKRCFPAALLALLLLLPGCTAEDRERTRENDRISALAQRDAARLALEYVEEKYGFEAAVLGYDVDGSDVFMAYRASPLVTVALTDGEKEFLVYLGLEAPEVRWDNYQRGEVAACLESWLLAGLALGEPCAADLIFRAAEDPSPGQAHINGEAYSVNCMLDFLYEGQSAPELLTKLTRVMYAGGWLGEDPSVEGVTLPTEGWPAETELQVFLRRYRDRESFASYGPARWGAGGREPSVQENPALLETVFLAREKEEVIRRYARYERVEAEGLAFVGRAMTEGMPGEVSCPAEGWVAGQVSYPQIPLYWPAGEDGGVRCGPLFCCTEPEGNGGVEYAISCTILPEFFARHGETLYYGICDPITGTLRVRRSLPFRPGRPGTYGEGNVYIRQTFWVGSPAEKPLYYTFLRRAE